MQSPVRSPVQAAKRRKTKNFFLFFDLPEEISLHILSFLSAMDVYCVSLTSNEFSRLSSENTLWRKLCMKQGWIIPQSVVRAHCHFDFRQYYSEKASLVKAESLKWTELSKPTGIVPSKRFKHTATVVGKHIIFIGGQETDTKRFSDVIYYDTENNTYSQPVIRGDKIPNFSRHTACLVEDRIFVFGGFDGFGTNFDLAVFDSRAHTWANLSKSQVRGDVPASRTNHAAAVIGKKMYVFGGNNNTDSGAYQVLDDLHVLDTDALTWSRPRTTGDKPCARSGHCLVTVPSWPNKLLLFGGGVWNEHQGWVQKFNDVYILDTESLHWTKPNCTGVVDTSTFSIPFVLGRFLFLFGGGSKPKHCVTNDLYVLDTATFSWTVPPVEGPKPPPRDMGTACVAGHNVYCLGGYAGGAVDYFDKLSFSPYVIPAHQRVK